MTCPRSPARKLQAHDSGSPVKLKVCVLAAALAGPTVFSFLYLTAIVDIDLNTLQVLGSRNGS